MKYDREREYDRVTEMYQVSSGCPDVIKHYFCKTGRGQKDTLNGLTVQ